MPDQRRRPASTRPARATRPENMLLTGLLRCTIIVTIVHATRVSGHPEREFSGGPMTARKCPLCDCPEPWVCYVAGKDKSYFEVITRLDGPPHAEDCACQPCQVRRTCLRKVMTLMAGARRHCSSWLRPGHWRTMTVGTEAVGRPAKASIQPPGGVARGLALVVEHL